MRFTLRAAAIAVLLLVPAPALPAVAQVPEAEFAARRDAVAARMGPGVLVALGGTYPADYDFRFRQLPAFRYLTGFLEPDAALVLVHQDDDVALTLFTARPTVRNQLYDGFREDPALLAARTGATVRPLGELGAVVDSLAATGLPFRELRDFGSGDAAARDTLTRGRAFIDALAGRHPDLEITDLHQAVNALRARKSDAEIGLLRRAIAITDAAHRRALEVIAPGAWEYEVEAAIDHAFRSRGADGPGYTGIVGSGLNSTVLHYVANDRRMEAGEVVLMDIGAQAAGYSADVTRTVPVSGTFSNEQRAVYNVVLESLKAAESEARPGATAAASLEASIRVRLEGMAELGLIESPDATYDPPWPVDCAARPDQCLQGMLYMIHGISHGIGLEVHDPAQFYTGPRTFQPGDVFTIEPGIYVNAHILDLLPDTPKNRAFIAAVRDAAERYHAIGVRIEDDYLMTARGLERLSHAPREPEAIEAAMAGR